MSDLIAMPKWGQKQNQTKNLAAGPLPVLSSKMHTRLSFLDYLLIGLASPCSLAKS
jgi:hypothetical protein